MAREILPNRRMSVTHTAEHEGMKYSVTVGYNDNQIPKEVFIRSVKPGSQIDEILDDTSVVVSLALQNGVTIPELRRSIGTGVARKVLDLMELQISEMGLSKIG
jgi:uncharacterized alkaline shock family protein YloU